MQQGESAAGASQSRRQLLGMTAFERHKRLMADYVHFYGGRPQPQSLTAAKTDYDILKEHYRSAYLIDWISYINGQCSFSASQSKSVEYIKEQLAESSFA